MGSGCVNDNRISDSDMDNCSSTSDRYFERLFGFNEWDSLVTVIKVIVKQKKLSFFRQLQKEDGNIESALVLIPMLILFLIGAQLIVATNIRNTAMALAQGEASARAISHQFQSSDEVLELGGGIEKVQVLITHRVKALPQLVPGLVGLFGGSPVTDVVGIAVIEPSNS